MARSRTWNLALGAILVGGAITPGLAAQHAYYTGPLESFALEEQEREAVAPDAFTGVSWNDTALRARVVLDGSADAEAFLDGPDNWIGFQAGRQLVDRTLAVRIPVGASVSGTIYLPRADGVGCHVYRFTAPGTKQADATPQAFYETKAASYSRLAGAGVPGAAWFRHQARVAWEEAARHVTDDTELGELQDRRRRFRERMSDLDRTFDMFSGGRAVAENLRMDRDFDVSSDEERTVPIDSLRGIDVEELDWAELIADLTPALDPLAAAIPVDQHAVIFPSLADLSRVLDEAERYGTPVLNMMEPRA